MLNLFLPLIYGDSLSYTQLFVAAAYTTFLMVSTPSGLSALPITAGPHFRACWNNTNWCLTPPWVSPNETSLPTYFQGMLPVAPPNIPHDFISNMTSQGWSLVLF